jgi:hypothetical protein
MATKTDLLFSILCLFVLVVIAAFQSSFLVGLVYGKGDSFPIEIGEISDYSENINTNTSASNSNSSKHEENDEIINCDMPPCPPGQVCIQSCPEVSIQ